MNAKQTNKKWTWMANEHSVPSIFKADNLKFRVAELLGNTPEDKANASLIASAPEMLKALNSILDYFSEYENDYSEKLDCFERARKVIAKAEGKK